MKKITLFIPLLMSSLSVIAQGGFFTSEGNTYSEEYRAQKPETKKNTLPTSNIRTDLNCFVHYTNVSGQKDSSRLITSNTFTIPIDTTQEISFSVYDNEGKKLRIKNHRLRSSCTMGNLEETYESGSILNKYKSNPFKDCNMWVLDLNVAEDKDTYRILIVQNGAWRSL